MPTNLDTVPSTVRQAVDLLAESLAENEREYFRITPVEKLFGNFAGAIRAGWSLWEMNTPLQRDAIKHYAIAHADDVSALIVHWTRALILDEDFFPMQCQCANTSMQSLLLIKKGQLAWKQWRTSLA